MPIASAQTPSPDSQSDTRTLAPINVTAQPESPFAPVDGYIARRSISATKTNTPLSETPQSVTVVTSEEIQDHGATSLQAALNYAAGVSTVAYGRDSRSENFRIPRPT